MEIDDYLRLAKGLADELTEALPDKMEIAALGVKEKAPFQLLTVRESLLWRTEELAQGACGALAQNQLAVAAILTRAIVESVAVLWRLQQLLLAYPLSDLGKLNDDLMNIFAASRVWKDETRSYQVLNFVDLIDRKIPGSRKHYDDLSEIAHPNWQGVAGMYSKIDKEKYFVLFGRFDPMSENRKIQIAILLGVYLELFKSKYNEISFRMPAFLSKLTPFES